MQRLDNVPVIDAATPSTLFIFVLETDSWQHNDLLSFQVADELVVIEIEFELVANQPRRDRV